MSVDPCTRDSKQCTHCGEEKPLDQFPKHRALMAGKGWAKRAAWFCDVCQAAKVTAATRHYRSDPAKRERDREASRRWKRINLGQPGMPR